MNREWYVAKIHQLERDLAAAERLLMDENRYYTETHLEIERLFDENHKLRRENAALRNTLKSLLFTNR